MIDMHSISDPNQASSLRAVRCEWSAVMSQCGATRLLPASGHHTPHPPHTLTPSCTDQLRKAEKMVEMMASSPVGGSWREL